MKRKTTNTSLRNFVWIIVGIILMAVMVIATTTISDTAITTTGNLNIDGNISLGNNPLHFESNGNSLLFINDSDGNFGIGTINPTNKLHVVTTGNPAKFESTSGNGRIEIDAPSTKNAGVQFFENNVLRWGIFNQGTDDSLKFQNKDFATRLVVQQDGNVGIGTTSPQYKLEVMGNVSLNNTLFVTTGGNVGIGIASPDEKLHSVISSTTQLEYIAKFENTGNGVNTDGILIKLGVTGNPGTSNNFIQFSDADTVDLGAIEGNGAGGISFFSASDERLKENIRETQYGLKDLAQIQVSDFNFIGSNVWTTGFIAQQLYEVYPLAVSVGGEDELKEPWKVSYSSLTPLTVKAIQEQQSQIEELKSENDLLKNRLTQIEEKLNSMELICSN